MILLLCHGCSFVEVRGPTSQATPTATPCTTSYLAPVIDGGLATGAFVAAGFTDKGSEAHPVTAFVPLVITALIFAASAAYGWVNVERCRGSQRPLTPRPPPVPSAPTR